MAGNLIGDAAWFLAGRRWGYSVMRLLCRISLSADTCVQRSESFLGRWGGASLIAAKFVPGVSVVAPPMAGALHMSNTRFLAYETLAALIWTLAFLLIGRLFHAAIADVLAVLANIGLAATAIIALVLAAFLRLALSPAPGRAARRRDRAHRGRGAAPGAGRRRRGAGRDRRARRQCPRARPARAFRARWAWSCAELPHGLGPAGRWARTGAVLRLPRRRQRHHGAPAC